MFSLNKLHNIFSRKAVIIVFYSPVDNKLSDCHCYFGSCDPSSAAKADAGGLSSVVLLFHPHN